MKVWINPDLCTGSGLCEEIAPEVFTLQDDGLAYVRTEAGPSGHDHEHPESIPAGQEEAAIEAAEECASECIFIEL